MKPLALLALLLSLAGALAALPRPAACRRFPRLQELPVLSPLRYRRRRLRRLPPQALTMPRLAAIALGLISGGLLLTAGRHPAVRQKPVAHPLPARTAAGRRPRVQPAPPSPTTARAPGPATPPPNTPLKDIIQMINQIVLPVFVLIGAWIASHQFALARRQRVLVAITEVLGEISNEKFGYKDGKLLRHWVCQRRNPLRLHEFRALADQEQARLLAMAMAHDRVAFFLEKGGGELRSVEEWQEFGFANVWRTLSPVILHVRDKEGEKGFCSKLQVLGERGLARLAKKREKEGEAHLAAT